MSKPNDEVLGHLARVNDSPATSFDVASYALPVPRLSPPDQSMEILMSDLHPDAATAFYFPEMSGSVGIDGHAAGTALSDKLGITSLFNVSDPKAMLDAYLFQPCGYSANLVTQQDRYATIHVTPEAGFSYASFEANIGFGTGLPGDKRPTVKEVIDRVLGIFRPGRWSLTLFVSREEDEPETSGEQGLALLNKGKFPTGYTRTDKICYE